MPQNTYKEPNVYTATKRVTPNVPRTPVDMYPLVIGTGAESVQRTNIPFKVTENAIAFEDSVVSVASVKYVDTWGDVTELKEAVTKKEGETEYVVDGDYTLVHPEKVIDPEKGTTAPDTSVVLGLAFVTEKAKVDENGSIVKDAQSGEVLTEKVSHENQDVYVTYTAEVSIDRYELKRWTDEDDIADFYGAEVVNGTNNNICIGGRLAKMAGSPVVYTLQIKKPAVVGTDEEQLAALLMAYKEALEETVIDKAGEPIWRICPADPGVEKAIKKFVLDMSEPEERAEKFASLNCVEAETAETFEALQEAYKSFCAKHATYRAQTLYPNTAKYTCSDGTEINVGGELIACAYAGFEQTMSRRSQSTTHSEIPAGLLNLTGVKLKRKQKNEIAALGVTLLTQDDAYGSIMVRDALSLDRSSAQTEDPCITMAVDYYAKDMRNACAPYIGKYNIDTETISKVRGTVDSLNSEHIQKKNLKAVSIVSLEQDPENLRSLIMVLKAGVLYPLKEINVTIVLE